MTAAAMKCTSESKGRVGREEAPEGVAAAVGQQRLAANRRRFARGRERVLLPCSPLHHHHSTTTTTTPLHHHHHYTTTPPPPLHHYTTTTTTPLHHQRHTTSPHHHHTTPHHHHHHSTTPPPLRHRVQIFSRALLVTGHLL